MIPDNSQQTPTQVQAQSPIPVQTATTITSGRIFTRQAAYVLDQYKYTILRQSFSGKDWARRIAAAGMVLLVILFCRFMEGMSEGHRYYEIPGIKLWECYAPFAILFVAGCFWFFEHCGSSERKTLIDEINQHFRNNPATLTVEQMNE